MPSSKSAALASSRSPLFAALVGLIFFLNFINLTSSDDEHLLLRDRPPTVDQRASGGYKRPGFAPKIGGTLIEEGPSSQKQIHYLDEEENDLGEDEEKELWGKVKLLSLEGGKEQTRRPPRRFKREDTSAALSKNVTLILEDLLKDYDKTQRPNYKKGGATQVRINMLIRSMGPISEEDMYYSMDCYFRQYWRDERLSFTGLRSGGHGGSPVSHLSLNIKMLEKIWKPDTYFHNGLSSYLHTITRPNKLLRISEHGDITYSMRLTIKARCPMVLKDFPMDWQSCPLVLGSFAYNKQEVEYVWTNPTSAVSYEGRLELSQFDIMRTEFRGLNYSRTYHAPGYSVLQVVIALQRHTGYFLIQIYLPCTLLVVLSWVGFWLNREATSDRVGLGITTVLTLSTIALESRTDLPKVHYATALDWFIICSFGYCIATLLEFAGVHYFTKVGSGENFSLDDNTLLEDEEDEMEDDDIMIVGQGGCEDEDEVIGEDDEDYEEDEDVWQDMEVTEVQGQQQQQMAHVIHQESCPQHHNMNVAQMMMANPTSPGYVTTPPTLPLSSAMKKGKVGKAVTIQEDNLGSGESAGEEAHRAAMINGRSGVVSSANPAFNLDRRKDLHLLLQPPPPPPPPPPHYHHHLHHAHHAGAVNFVSEFVESNSAASWYSDEVTNTSLENENDPTRVAFIMGGNGGGIMPSSAFRHSMTSVDQLDQAYLPLPPPPPSLRLQEEQELENSRKLRRPNGFCIMGGNKNQQQQLQQQQQIHVQRSTAMVNSLSLPSVVPTRVTAPPPPAHMFPPSTSSSSLPGLNSIRIISGGVDNNGADGNGHNNSLSGNSRQRPPMRNRANSVRFPDKTPCWWQLILCLLANQDYRRQRQREATKQGSTNSTSRIDSVARVFFPLSFFLFNLVYWYSYFQAQKPFNWQDHALKGNVI